MKIQITDYDGEIFDTVEVPDAELVSDGEGHKQNFLLKPSLCSDFRRTINSSPIFYSDPNYMAKYHLCCAVMDRLDTCINKINMYGEYPDSEEDFLEFMMYSAMVIEAVAEILDQLAVHKKKQPIYNSDEDYRFFGEIYRSSPLYNPNAKEPTDDDFFQYFRSLCFAHPAETSHHKFRRPGEVQYSPWVIVNRSTSQLRGLKDAVGVRIYTNLSVDIIDLRISFATIKEYLKTRYERISLATEWALAQIEEQKNNWRKTKVNRLQSPVDILKEISSILTSRGERTYCLSDLIRYMECPLTEESNHRAVDFFRSAITDIIPSLADAVDNLDHDLVGEICAELFERPRVMHNMGSYQLEKIFCDLDAENHPAKHKVDYALIQADLFSKEFARKWVKIDTQRMPQEEILLLTRTACYLERRKQQADGSVCQEVL